MTHRGHMHTGVVVLDTPADIPDGAPVEGRVVEEPAEAAADEIPSLYDRLKSAVGKAQGLPEDAAHNHDHYLYDLCRRPPLFPAGAGPVGRMGVLTSRRTHGCR